MKLRTIPLIASISLVVFGMGVIGFVEIHNKLLNLRIADQRKALESDRQSSFPISKGTIPLLLAVGAIGALSVHYKYKTSQSTSQRKSPQLPARLKFNWSTIRVNTGYFWPGESHMKTLHELKTAIRGDASFIILTGDTGIGKSTLIKYLKKKLAPECIFIGIGSEIQDAEDLFRLIAANTGINKDFKSKGIFFIHFNQFIHSKHAESKKILLIVNDFTAISEELIKELTFLSNIKIEGQKILKILISGESISFSPDEQYKSTSGSVVTCRLKGLNRSETNSYINYIFKRNGIRNTVFPQETIQTIFLYSRGIPLEINRICNCALNLANEQKLRTITPRIIKKCCKELNLIQSGQDNDYSKIPQKKAQTKALFDNFLSRFTTWKWFEQSIKFARITKQLATDAFKKILSKSHSFIQSATKNLYIKKRSYWHTIFVRSGLFDSYLWNSVLSVSLVALALVFSLWYQGILPSKPDAPKSDFYQTKYYLPIMDQDIFHVEEPKPAKAAYFVQVGAFLVKENANKTVGRLTKKGYLAEIVTFTDSKDRLWHTVRIGEYPSLKVAKKHAAEFSNQEKMDSIVLPLK